MTEINLSLLQEFIEESREHLDEMESLLLQLANGTGSNQIFNDIFRTIHNIKGASQLTGLERISRLSHTLEDLLDLLRQEKITSNSSIVEILFSGRDRIVQIVDELVDSQQEIASIDDLLDELSNLMKIENDTIDVNHRKSDKPAAKKEPATKTKLPATVPEEENDQELFEIFNTHLQKQFTFLLGEISHISNRHELARTLTRRAEVIKSLWMSANYMGYDDLTSMYDLWIREVETTLHALERGENVSLRFMRGYLDKLIGLFPQLEVLSPDNAIRPDIPLSDSSSENEDVTADVLAAFDNASTDSASSSGSRHAIIDPPLLNQFIDEVTEHLNEMESLLLQLIKEPDQTDFLNDLCKTIQNIKYAARSEGLDIISRLTHRLEDLLELLCLGKLPYSRSVIEVLMIGRDRIERLIQELADKREELSPVDDLLHTLDDLMQGKSSAMTGAAPDASSSPNRESESILSQETAFDEEHDQELFGIFLAHLQDQFTFLKSALPDQNLDPLQSEALSDCLSVLHQLRSSANYMGYNELSRFYDNWEVRLENTRASLMRGENVEPDCINHFVEQLSSLITQLQYDNTETTKTTALSVEQQPEHLSSPTQSSGSESGYHGNTQSEQTTLFKRLNNALQNSLQNVSSSENDTLCEVFDELVSSQKEKQALSMAAKVAMAEKRTMLSKLGKRHKQEATPTEEIRDKKVKKTIRVDADKIDTLMNQVGELVVDRSFFYQLFNEFRDLQSYLKETTGIDQKEIKLLRTFTYRLSEAISALSRTSNELQEGVMKMRMLPISHIFNRYPRLVHDLSRNSDKKVKLIIRGEDTELDKMIVEELSDPLIHIIRNAIDHGLESTEERLRLGKPETGILELEAYQESNHIVIEVTDDGRGIDPNRIKTKAIERGLYTHEDLEKLTNRELTNLILAPGFSTAENISNTSGRGVGMDVVKKNIEKLNGTLEIDTVPGRKTQMRLKIPLTLAIIHALMVRVGTDMFTIPLANVDETVHINEYDTSVVEGVEVIYLRGATLPIFRLSSLFNVRSDKDSNKSFVVIVETDGQRTGFVVDELLGQEEVVIKPLEDYVQEKSGFSGATIVGEGQISLILDIYELVKMTARKQIDKQTKQSAMLKGSIKPRQNRQAQELGGHA